MPENDVSLHRCNPGGCNSATKAPDTAQGYATTVQQGGLKALADKVVARNAARNEDATAPETPCNNTGSKTPHFVEAKTGLDNALEIVCQDLPITVAAAKAELDQDDIDDWHAGRIDDQSLRAFALARSRNISLDDAPLSAKLRAYGQPIGLEIDGAVVCWLVSGYDAAARTDLAPRITGDEAGLLAEYEVEDIRRLLEYKARFGGTVSQGDDTECRAPVSVRCIDCKHFVRYQHPHLGKCAAGVKPEGIAGLWDTDNRYCPKHESLESHGD